MENGPVSCLPTTPKMSKAKKVIEEALENQNPELDLADKGVVSFEEMPGLSKCTKFKHFLLWKLVSYLQSPYKDISIILQYSIMFPNYYSAILFFISTRPGL